MDGSGRAVPKTSKLEDLIRFDHAGGSYAIYRSPDNEFYCTDGLCTHEQVHLADGLVMDGIIECPMHNGQFEYRTGKAVRSPACDDLRTYPVRVYGWSRVCKIELNR